MKNLFPRPDVAAVLHFAVCVYVDIRMFSCRSVRLERGDKQRKAVIRDISSVGHRGVAELECINVVYWSEALYGSSSHDAIVVVGFVLEKHFDGDFTPDQEKEITSKRWPPGVPKLKT